MSRPRVLLVATATGVELSSKWLSVMSTSAPHEWSATPAPALPVMLLRAMVTLGAFQHERPSPWEEDTSLSSTSATPPLMTTLAPQADPRITQARAASSPRHTLMAGPRWWATVHSSMSRRPPGPTVTPACGTSGEPVTRTGAGSSPPLADPSTVHPRISVVPHSTWTAEFGCAPAGSDRCTRMEASVALAHMRRATQRWDHTITSSPSSAAMILGERERRTRQAAGGGAGERLREPGRAEAAQFTARVARRLGPPLT
mmetsp:Transcript_19586/g.65805  ORF Transcript_19586/g.65805 Transcript_19586/m.65805 type:complete len:258 (-) Transcript_19586:804-1577(-)